MSLEAAENLIPGVAWFRTAKGIAICVLVVLLLLLGGYMIWTTFIAGGAAQAKHDIVQAQGQTAISNAGAAAGKDAIPVITNNYYSQRASDTKSQENRNAILQAPGAAAPVDPALAAIVRRAICLRASASGLPECRELLGVRP
jgi:zona occludens toxin (predicted ATPase)